MPRRRDPSAIYRAFARQQALKAGINPGVFERQINQESGFNPTARSGAGAVGIAQIVPRYHPGVDPTNPYQALSWAAKYMGGLVKQYGGSYEKALSVYNSGQPTKYLDPNFAGGQTYNYVKRIMGGQAPSAAVPERASAAVPAPTSVASPLPNRKQRGLALLRGLLQDQPIPELIKNIRDIPTPEFSTEPPSLPQGSLPQAKGIKITKPKTTLERKAVGLVKEYLGTPYVWGGTQPGGFDCSGLLQYTWGKLGVKIPRVTYDQWKAGAQVQGALQPGDAVFFHPGPSGPEHVGMYIGDGKFIEAPRTGLNVRISELKGRSDYMGARRYA